MFSAALLLMNDTPPTTPMTYLRLARPTQWAKSVFVLIGPLYGLADHGVAFAQTAWWALLAAVAFSLASSASYVFNDILDAEADRAHPRKRRRPIASGQISPKAGMIFAGGLLVLAAGATVAMPTVNSRLWLGVVLLLYLGNVATYSMVLKHHVIADVMSLSIGFVLRVFAGCAAIWIIPSVWLLNCTFFLAMFLAFGKRLGERRALGDSAITARKVQSVYTDELLRMAVVVTGVATLMGYTIYVQSQDAYVYGFNLLWLTVLPATYVLLRCVVVLEEGRYDDPTELAVHDRGFQAGSLVFFILTAGLVWHFKLR